MFVLQLHFGHPYLHTQYPNLFVALHSLVALLLFGSEDIPRCIGKVPAHD